METRRERILSEGMRLFGEQGYAATSVAQIEEAAGLSPGSGSLYKHFRSKKELLAAGLDRLLASRIDPVPVTGSTSDVPGILDNAARSGFERMEHDRDLNRLLFRGLTGFPELLQRFGTEEIARIQKDTAQGLALLAADGGGEGDWEAVAAVLQAAVAHYWLLEDLFGEHPTGVARDRFIAALTSLAASAVAPGAARASREP